MPLYQERKAARSAAPSRPVKEEPAFEGGIGDSIGKGLDAALRCVQEEQDERGNSAAQDLLISQREE